MTMTIDGSNGFSLDGQFNSASSFGFKNRIINGAMGIWQRGTSGFTTSGVYCADRWIIGTGGTLTSVGQSTDVPTGFKFSLSAAGTNQPTIYQKVEAANSADLVGQSVTLSFWCKQTVGSGTNSLYASFYYANSSDNFGAVTQIGSTVFFTGTTGWVQYSTTFTNLPSGAANGVEIAIGNVGAGSATFLITGVQLEKGSTATSFDYRPYGTELALCQRYYYKKQATQSADTFCVSWVESTTQANGMVPFPVPMRTNPTALEQSGTASNFRIRYAGSATQTCNNVPVFYESTNISGMVVFTCASGLTAGQASALQATGSSAYLAWSAEL